MPNAKLLVQTIAVAGFGWVVFMAAREVPQGIPPGNAALIDAVFGYALFALVGWIWDRCAQFCAWFTRSEPEAVRIEPTFDAPFSEAGEDGVPLLRRFSLTKRGPDFRYLSVRRGWEF